MIPRSPLRTRPRRTWLRPRRRQAEPKPEGLYIFTHRDKEYRLPGKYVQDPTSPSDGGLRWIAAKESKPILAQITFEVADGRCEMHNNPDCWKFAPRWSGHPHHVRHKKMGNAFGDDRIWISVDGELVRIRIWGCPTCHRNHHNKLHFGEKTA